MKHSALILLLAASTVAASAQAPTQPANPAAKPSDAPAVKTAGNPVRDSGQSWWSRHFGAASKPTAPTAKAAAPKLPLGVPAPGIPAVTTTKETAFCLQYQEIKVGDGAVAEPNKMYKVHYTGWLGETAAMTARKFDSSYDHPGPPLRDKEGKPVMGDDGKPKLDVPQPMQFPQGFGRLIPGFDQGLEGMKIGGKRRIFIPWQLAYGAKGRPGPDKEHPGIPEKANLIFDVELVDVTDLPMPANHPPMGGMRPMPGGRPMPGAPGARRGLPASSSGPQRTECCSSPGNRAQASSTGSNRASGTHSTSTAEIESIDWPLILAACT